MQYRSKINNGALSLVILALPIMSIACADPIKPADKSETTPAAFTDTGILGLHFEDVDKHAPTVKQVFPDTPSAKADLRVDDIINEINGRPTKDSLCGYDI
jgi:C-terminal processing protease CtpA/Prc